MVKEAYCHGQVQEFVWGFSALCRVGSLGKVWAITLGGRTIKKISQEKIRIANQGAGLSWGMSLRVVESHQSLA